MGILNKLFGKMSKESGNESILGKYYKLEDLQPIVCGNSGVTLSPLGGAQLINKQYPTIINKMWNAGTNIQQFLPTLDFSTEKKVYDFMLASCKVTELGLKFSYVIIVNHIPTGLFIITTPYLNNKTLGYNHWTMDFFVFEAFEGKGIMSIAIPRMLLFLKKLGVDDLHLIVDQNNIRCLNLLKNVPLDEIDNEGWHSSQNGQKPKVFSCPLSVINFQHR